MPLVTKTRWLQAGVSHDYSGHVNSLLAPAADSSLSMRRKATVVFAAGPSGTGVKQPGQKEETLPETATYSHPARPLRSARIRDRPIRLASKQD
jgi:hypothetical protein